MELCLSAIDFHMRASEWCVVKRRWGNCKSEMVGMWDDIVRVIEGMEQQVGWMMSMHATLVHKEEEI
jgi:hypothetical protein